MTGREYKRMKWRERKARWRLTKKLMGEKRTDQVPYWKRKKGQTK